MIQLDNIETFGWEAAIRGMRNPKNSWDRIDSQFYNINESGLGPNDLKLAHTLCNAGPEHRKFLRMIHLQMDITAPLYWWKEYDTYKIATVANSCSTMHKLDSRDLVLDDFSHEHLTIGTITLLMEIITTINNYRKLFKKTKNKDYWWQMVQLLPTSYNQKRTVDLNYETLHSIYLQRKNHKLDEWKTFCEFIEKLPYSELITGEIKND